MRARLAILIAAAAVVSTFSSPASAVGSPSGHTITGTEVIVAQQQGGGDESQGGETGSKGGSTSETGAQGDGDPAATETGPPWTYQMARIAVVLLALTVVGVFLAYWRFVAQRKKAGF